MDSIKAVCQCKELSENEQVLAIRKYPLEDWGFWSWSINVSLLIMTGGGWAPFLIGWVLGGYFLTPTYKCQFCGKKIEKENYR